MTGLVFLTIAVICALISRILLFIAAIRISAGWAIGVFFPFGPMLFRLSYPDEARSSLMFRIGTLGFVFLYFLVGPAALITPTYKTNRQPKPPRQGYASEFVNRFISGSNKTAKTDTRSLSERRAANERELERLGKWSEALRRQKRDLLRSDIEANRAYNIDLQEYEAALAAATTEKQALANASAAK